MITNHNRILVSVVIPVFNSESTIGQLTDRLLTELNPVFETEIVLVNDSSSDNSKNVCINLHKKYPPQIKFYSLAKNVGEHNAVMAGLNHASGDYAVIIDDDLQNPVSEVRRIVEYAAGNNYDVIYSYYEKKKHSFFRNAGSKFNDFVANIMLKKPKDLYLSSFKVINRFTINEIIKYDLPFPYVDGLILRITDNIGKLKVVHDERRQGKSGYTLVKLVSLWLNMFTNFSILPLRISVYLGFIFSLFGLILGIENLIEKLINPEVPTGYASIIVAVAIFSGVQLISLGMIGEYLGRVFLSQNKKPQYTVREKYETEIRKTN